eukprot:6204372-Pleurochrysis_carterae.AAC.1
MNCTFGGFGWSWFLTKGCCCRGFINSIRLTTNVHLEAKHANEQEQLLAIAHRTCSKCDSSHCMQNFHVRQMEGRQ